MALCARPSASLVQPSGCSPMTGCSQIVIVRRRQRWVLLCPSRPYSSWLLSPASEAASGASIFFIRFAISMAVITASKPLLPDLPPGALDRLLQRVGGDDAEDDGHARVQRHAPDAVGRLAGHVVEVRRLAAHHAAQTDDGVIAAALGQALAPPAAARRSPAPRPRPPTRGRRRSCASASWAPASSCSVSSLVEAGDDDGEGQPLTVRVSLEDSGDNGHLGLVLAVTFDYTSTPRRWPSFVRFVSR